MVEVFELTNSRQLYLPNTHTVFVVPRYKRQQGKKFLKISLALQLSTVLGSTTAKNHWLPICDMFAYAEPKLAVSMIIIFRCIIDVIPKQVTFHYNIIRFILKSRLHVVDFPTPLAPVTINNGNF